jgi:ankyrin repeat protein
MRHVVLIAAIVPVAGCMARAQLPIGGPASSSSKVVADSPPAAAGTASSAAPQGAPSAPPDGAPAVTLPPAEGDGTTFDPSQAVSVAAGRDRLLYVAGLRHDHPPSGSGFVACVDPGGHPRWVGELSGGLQGSPAVAVDGQGGAFVVGSFDGQVTVGGKSLSGHARSDIFLARFDPSGQVLWARAYGGEFFESARAVAVDPQGSFYVTGTYQYDFDLGGGQRLSNSKIYDIYVAKFSADGAAMWSQSFHATGGTETRGNGVALGPSGDVYVTGLLQGGARVDSIRDPGGSNDSAFVARLSGGGGAARWFKRLPATGAASGIAIAVDGAERVFVAGDFENTMTVGSETLTSAGQSDAFLASFDAQGNPRWGRSFGGSAYDHARGVAASEAAGVFVVGTVDGATRFGGASQPAAGGAHGFAARFDAAGTPAWMRPLGVGRQASVNAVATTPEGEWVGVGGAGSGLLAGTTRLRGVSGDGAFVFRGPGTQEPPAWTAPTPPASGASASGGASGATSGGRTPTGNPAVDVEKACESGDLALVQKLVPAQIDAKASGPKGWTFLMTAAYKGRTEVVQYLLSRGADPNASLPSGYTVLMQAARFGYLETVTALVERGADPNVAASRAGTALQAAASDFGGHVDVVRYLLAHGARPDVANAHGITPLMASLDLQPPNLEMTRALLDGHASPEIGREDGYRPLISAAGKGLVAHVALLLDHGAAVEGATKLGITALFEAAHDGHADVVKLLLDRGAKAEVVETRYGDSALMRAVASEHLDVVQLLVSHGAKVNTKNLAGKTALSLATGSRRQSIASYLRAHGAQ